MPIEIYPSIWLHEIPLPGNPLKAINCYFIKGTDRNLIVDTGFNTEEGRTSMVSAMAELGFDACKTDLLVTHLHSDHCGLAAQLSHEDMQVFSGPIDGEIINDMAHREYWEKFDQLSIFMDLGQDQIAFDEHPGYKFCPKKEVAFTYLTEGSILNVGSYAFQVVDFPGHTPGHIGLYEPNHRILISGDHILEKITPNIAFWGFEQDILAIYLQSLDKAAALDVDIVLSSHRAVIRDHQRRIHELKAHHYHRLDEILGILKDRPLTVRQVAAAMHWDLRISDWEQFPNNQKWFAAGEALSHLEHLVETQRIEKSEREGILYYARL